MTTTHMESLEAEYHKLLSENIAQPKAKERKKYVEPEEPKKVGNSLARPGDIQAVDSTDLLTSLVAQNIDAVHDKNEQRERRAWVSEQNRRIRQNYTSKATVAYEKVWAACKGSNVGHDFRTTDVRGRSVEVCDVCSYHKAIFGRYDSESEKTSKRNQSSGMNEDLIRLMVDRMIELDLEAGVLVWPVEDDMPTHKLSRQKKGWRK